MWALMVCAGWCADQPRRRLYTGCTKLTRVEKAAEKETAFIFYQTRRIFTGQRRREMFYYNIKNGRAACSSDLETTERERPNQQNGTFIVPDNLPFIC